jgi:APA family basic amino acid/polyamine antiporter
MWLATALVVGNMVGSGVFLLPSALAAYGGISLFAWLFTGAGAILLALVFARLGRAYPQTGGPYAYSRRAFGDFIGFQTAWSYWINVWAGNAAIAVAFVGYLAVFWSSLTDNRVLAAGVAIAAIWFLTGVNALGLRQGAWLQAITTVLKLVPLLVLCIVGLFYIHTGNFTPLNVSDKSMFGAITAAAALTLWAFIGLESATVPAEDLEDPERTLPRSTLLGTVTVAILYLLSTVVVMGVIPNAQLATSTAPFADAANAIFGGRAGDLVAIGAIIATFGCLNGWILLQGQAPLAAARDGLFPKAFARKTAAGVPVVGLVVSSVLVTVLVASNYTKSLVDLFTFVILLATLATLIPYAYAAMAELMLFINDRAAFSVRNLTKDVVIAGLAFTYSVWAIWGAGADVVLKGTMMIFAGIPIYIFIKWRAAVQQPAASTVSEPAAPAKTVVALNQSRSVRERRRKAAS